MLVLSKGGLSAGQAARYYQEKYARDDYYSEERTIPGQWYGKGAERLGLAGEVQREDFQAVLYGRDPRSGEIVVEAAHDGERRAGWDATFNAPKSVSIQALIGGDARLIAAHRRATDRALGELERFVQSRQHGGHERVNTENMVAARFDHVAARPSAAGHAQGFGPDPHLHTHVVIANLTQRNDGEWRAIEPLELYRSQEHATAVYRAELAGAVQRLGYDVTLTGQRGEWELAGYQRDHIAAFSHRRQDITKHLEERGLTGAGAAQIAAHQTRLAKDFRDDTTLRAEWQERAETLGLDLQRLTAAAHERGPLEIVGGGTAGLAREAVAYASAHHTEREAVMDVRALEASALQHGMGVVDVDTVRAAMATQQEHGDLLAVQSERWPQGGYTTREMLTLEQENIALMHAGQGQAQPMARAAEVKAWAHQRGLYADQARVAEHTLTSPDWLTAIEGKAGATKTTTVGAIREFAETRGYTVRGYGPTTGSVRALEEAGVPASTVASLNASRVEPGQGRGELWIVDESSLLSTRQTNTLLHRAREAQVERVIFVGDQRQHGAVEAGRPMAQMQAAGMATARLETIRRQRDPALRHAVELAAKGRTADAVQQLNQRGRVSEIPERDQRYAAIAREYARSTEAGQHVLVVSPANEERTALNTVIRTELQSRGQVAREGREHTVLVNRTVTGPQRRYAHNYAVGDVVHYRRGSRKEGIAAGAYARVEAVDREHNLLTVRTDGARLLTYAPTKLRGVEVYREEHRQFAEGDRIQFRAPQREQRIANGALGRLARLDPESGQVTIRMDSGRTFSTALESVRHIEYGYATTSHGSQGATVDRVLVHIDTEQSATLVNRQQFYVSLSRARSDARVFTNDTAHLPSAVARDARKSTALEAVRESQRNVERRQEQEGTREREPQLVLQRETAQTRQQEWRHERSGVVQMAIVGREHTEWRHERLQTQERTKGSKVAHQRSGTRGLQLQREEGKTKGEKEQHLDLGRGR